MDERLSASDMTNFLVWPKQRQNGHEIWKLHRQERLHLFLTN